MLEVKGGTGAHTQIDTLSFWSEDILFEWPTVISCPTTLWNGFGDSKLSTTTDTSVGNTKVDQSTLLFLIISLFEISSVTQKQTPCRGKNHQTSNLSTFETFLATVSCQAPVISRRPLPKKVYRPSFSKVSNCVCCGSNAAKCHDNLANFCQILCVCLP